MRSQGKLPNLARLVISATLPFDMGEMMHFFFNRPSPSTESGHGFSRRQTCAQLVFSSSVSPSILYCLSRSSRTMRFKSSRLVHGISPLLTLSIAGPYPRRQRSVNSTQLISKPLTLPQLVASAITELRQSTTVPNVSKTHAFTLADSNFIKPPVSCWTRTAGSSENDVAMTLAPAATKNPRPIQLERHTKSLSTKAVANVLYCCAESSPARCRLDSAAPAAANDRRHQAERIPAFACKREISSHRRRPESCTLPSHFFHQRKPMAHLWCARRRAATGQSMRGRRRLDKSSGHLEIRSAPT